MKQSIIMIILFFVGAIQASYSIIIPLITLRFGIPLANKVNDETRVNMRPLISLYKKSLTLWFTIDIIALVVLFLFVPFRYMVAYVIGCLSTLIRGFFKSGNNQANMQDFCDMVRKLYSEDDIRTIFNYLRSSEYSGIPEI